MKRAIVRRNGVITNQAEMPEAELLAWIDKHKAMGSFGRDEHQIELVGAVLDEEGNEISPAQMGIIPAEFEIEIVDVAAQLAQEEINKAAEKYLADTDWIIIRNIETGVPVPQEITDARAAARAAIVR